MEKESPPRILCEEPTGSLNQPCPSWNPNRADSFNQPQPVLGPTHGLYLFANTLPVVQPNTDSFTPQLPGARPWVSHSLTDPKNGPTRDSPHPSERGGCATRNEVLHGLLRAARPGGHSAPRRERLRFGGSKIGGVKANRKAVLGSQNSSF